MLAIQTWGQAILTSLQTGVQIVLAHLPSFIGAIVVILIGWVIASGIGKLIQKLLKVIKVNEAFEKLGMTKEKVGGLEAARVGGLVVKWFLFIIFFMAGMEILRLTQVTDFLKQVIYYFPNIIVAVLMILVGAVVGNFLYDLVKRTVTASKLPTELAGFLGSLSKWSVLIFACLAALVQLKVASELIKILFTGIVAMIVIAGGLAFGLGGREHAKNILDILRRSITGRKEE